MGVKIDDNFGSAGTRSDIAIDSRGELRFARLLAHDQQNKLLHVHGIGWHYWAGTHWAVDEGEVIAKNAVIELLRAEWATAYSDNELQRDIKRCQSASGLNGILNVAAVLPGIAAKVSDLDADPYALNCANGVLDLHTLQMKEHDPRDRHTKVTRAAYVPGARSTDWAAFLERVLPDPEVRAYLARFVGVSLIGETTEQEFTIGTGEGANGKGVAYETILNALGDYGHTMDSDMLTASSHNGSGNEAKPGLVNLRGRRLVVTSETEREVKLAAALMKKLTGGDPIQCRALYRDPIQFEPSHSLFMVTNHLPKVPGNDPAVWRRLRVVPFDVVIPEGERDPQLKHRLKLTAVDAVLTWAVEGLADYRARGGMDAPEAVKVATSEYQRESDSIARFLDERCIFMRSMYRPVGELWDAWVAWAKDEGVEDITKRQFAEQLDKRGTHVEVRKVFGKSVRVRAGVDLQGDE